MALTAERILALTEPEGLFSAPANITSEHRQLALDWHPDRNSHPKATEVVAQINHLYGEAKRRVAAGIWHTPGVIELEATDGRQYRIRYRKRHAFELGEFVYGDTNVVFLLRQEFADLFHNAQKQIAALRYRDGRMQKEVARYLPDLKATFETKDGRCVMVMGKTEDVFLLRDLQKALGGKVDPKHTAWIVSALHNVACYLEYAGLTHNGISVDTVFVSPKFHSVLLLGGWWYAAQMGARLNAVPAVADTYGPPDILRDKRAQYRMDLTLLRLAGRTLLGDPTGMNIDAPKPMVDFLRRPTTGSARQDYASWMTSVLPASFGARRFVELVVSPSDVYEEK